MRSLRVGRLFNIDIRVYASWLFIFALLMWSLLFLLARWHGDWSPVERFALAAGASLAFFAGIVVHELAHSMVARRFGAPVRSISLFLFGAISDVDNVPQSPRGEFLSAIAGPAASLLLGGCFLGVEVMAFGTGASGLFAIGASISSLGVLATLTLWLAIINIAIGLFNLIPGFPLDGGRVVRSLLWHITGDFVVATRSVSMLGQVIGVVLIGSGVAISFGVMVPVLGFGVVSGLWLAFVGWFLCSAASEILTQSVVDEAMAGHSVAEVMREHGHVVTPSLSITNLVHEFFIISDERALPVVSEGQLLGLVTIADVRAVPPAEWPRMTVADVMRTVSSLVVTSPGQPLATAFEQLTRYDLGQLPVLVDGRIVGVLLRRDALRWLELAAWRSVIHANPRADVPARPAAAPAHEPPSTAFSELAAMAGGHAALTTIDAQPSEGR